MLASCVWLIYQYLGGDGELTFTYRFRGDEQAISRLQPHGRALDLERNQDNGETYQRLVGEPAYFTATLPGSYDNVAVTIEYQNPYQTVIELGVKQTSDPALFDYIMQPLENKLVDDNDWEAVQTDNLVLLQKESKYESVEDFLNHPPLDAHVGTYLSAPTPNFVDPSYQPDLNRGSDLKLTLRGAHQFYSYAQAGEHLEYKMELHSLNYLPGDDVASINLTQNDVLLDSGFVTNNGETTLETIAPTTGVYVLSVAASDDLLLTHLQSSQERLVVGKSIHLAGSAEYQSSGIAINTTPTSLKSAGNWLTAVAKHSYGVGDYEMYNGTLTIPKVDTPVTWLNPIADREFTFTAINNDLYLQTDAYFAVPGAESFDPWFGFRTISRYSDLDHLDYVLSGIYTAPTRLRGWTTATTEFDLATVTQTKPNNLQFIVSAPGLEAVPEGIKIRSITITAKQPPLTFSYLWEKLFGAN